MDDNDKTKRLKNPTKRKGTTAKKEELKIGKKEGERKDINEYGQVQYHSAQVNKTIKKNKTITFLNSRRRDGRTSTEEIVWPDVILLEDGTATTRTPGWKENKNAKQNEARSFSFDLTRRVQSREVKRKGRMVFNSTR